MSIPLLMTKLYIPSPGRYLVRRAQLFEKLDGCLEPDCRLALISAPAGFGKTTLISAWLAAAKESVPECRVAWLSIDEGDNDPVIFWSYVISALQTQQEGVGEQALSALAAPGGDLARKLPLLINDLAQLRGPCVIVLDDYHLIRTPAIHQSLAFFIEHVPQYIHLMIASRTDPPLPLALLRGRGQLLEIRLNDLRFSDEDADTYLNGGIGLNLETQAVQALNLKTEGWIAGLQMATLALRDTAAQRGPKAAVDFVASFSGSNRFILDYLIEEVLNRQPEPIQQFLVQTSILDRLCGPLCDALLGEEGASQSALQHLEHSNLFILPLDAERYWYRYHQLFADLLRKRLTQTAPVRIPELHRRAIGWYEQNGLIPSAIHHAFELKDFSKAAALMAQVVEAMWGRGEHATLLGWLDSLPESEKQRYPSLLTFQVSMLITAGKLNEAETCIPILEQYIAETLAGTANQKVTAEQTALIGNIFALRTYIASFYGDKPALFDHAKTALQNLTREQDAGQRCAVSMVLANAYLTQGDLVAADEALSESVAAGKRARKPHMVLSSLANRAIVQWYLGNLNAAALICQEGLALVEQNRADRSPMAVDLFLTWGLVLSERGAVDEAEASIGRGLDTALEQQYIWQAAWGYHAKARLLVAQGDLEGADAAIHAGEQWVSTHEVPAHVSCELAGPRVNILLRIGKAEQAEKYLEARGIRSDGAMAFPHASEYLALARLKWQQGDAKTASSVLDRITACAETAQQKGVLIEALLLLALVHRSGGKSQSSMALVERALGLAETDGYQRIFLNEGDPVASLLEAAAEQNVHAQYARRLLNAFPFFSGGVKLAQQPQPAPRNSIRSCALPLAEPLSRREMETLQLIAEGFSNKEIAQKLCVSLRTVKYYSTGLYNKLGVDSRMQAVIRARELGLL